MTKLVFRLKGGSGSGNFDHAGRPGEVGGSMQGADKGGGGLGGSNKSPTTPKDWMTKMASNSRYWRLSEEDFAKEVDGLLAEQFPGMSHDSKADLIRSAIQQRQELTADGIVRPRGYDKMTHIKSVTKDGKTYEIHKRNGRIAIIGPDNFFHEAGIKTKDAETFIEKFL